MLTTLIIAIVSLVADLTVGLSAYKMAKSSREAQASNTATNANILNLVAKQGERLDNHEYRIVILERQKAA